MRFAGSLKGFEQLRYERIDPVYPHEFEETEDMFALATAGGCA